MFFFQLFRGLEHIHRFNIIHRDIKPSNLLIQLNSGAQRPTLAIADFGCACWEDASVGEASLQPTKTVDEMIGNEELTWEELRSKLDVEMRRRSCEVNPPLFHTCSRTDCKIGTKYFCAPEIVSCFVNIEYVHSCLLHSIF